jgi:nicotinate-nucleotide adenylyltransferase
MRIALYGGSFNPPHIGHVLAATVVLATEEVDELWFVPTYQHMMGKKLLDFEHRIEMTRLIARSFGHRVSVSRAEQRLAQLPDFQGSTAINLVRSVIKEWSGDSFRFVMGSDLLEHFYTWEGAEEIKKLAPPIIIPRMNHQDPHISDPVIPDVSSTIVRRALGAGLDVRKLVSKEVLEYIRANHLYADEFAPGSTAALRAGCKCPVIDNHYGRGYRGQDGIYNRNPDCPVHKEST